MTSTLGPFFWCQTVNIWLMTLFLFTMTFYMKMTQETTRNRWIDRSRTDVTKIYVFFHCTRIGLQKEYRSGSRVVKTRHRSTAIQSDWHDVVTSSLSSDHTITICSQRSSGSLLHQIEAESNRGREWRSSWKTWANSRVTCPFLYPKQMKPASHSFLYLVHQAGDRKSVV